MKRINMLYMLSREETAALDTRAGLVRLPSVIEVLCDALPLENVVVVMQQNAVKNRMTALPDDERGCVLLTAALPNGGSLCSALLAADLIDSERALLVRQEHAPAFVMSPVAIRRLLDGGADCSFCMTDQPLASGLPFVKTYRGGVTMLSEDAILDRSAAGLFAFRNGSDFVRAAKDCIIKGKGEGERYCLCDAVNEMILSGKTVRGVED